MTAVRFGAVGYLNQVVTLPGTRYSALSNPGERNEPEQLPVRQQSLAQQIQGIVDPQRQHSTLRQTHAGQFILLTGADKEGVTRLQTGRQIDAYLSRRTVQEPTMRIVYDAAHHAVQDLPGTRQELGLPGNAPASAAAARPTSRRTWMA